MISLHLKDGRTLKLDLENGAQELLQELKRPEFQDQITAVTLTQRHPSKGSDEGVGVQYSLTRPEGFDGTCWFHVEAVPMVGRVRGGERVVLFAGDVRVTIMAHRSQPAARVSIARVGRRKFNPEETT